MKNSVWKKVLAAGMMMSLAGGLLIGCGGPEKEGDASSEESVQEETTLTLWRATANDDRNAWWEETLKKFEEENPGIKVEYLGVAGDDAAFNQKLDMASAADEMPDVISAYCEANYITRELLEPLDTYFETWESKDQIPETYLE